MPISYVFAGVTAALLATTLGGPLPAATDPSAGWSQDGYGPGNTGYNPAEHTITAHTVTALRYRFSLVSPPLGHDCDAVAPPVVAGGGLYDSDQDGIGAYDPATGRRRWHLAVSDIEPPTLAVVGTTLLAATISSCESVSDPDGDLYALDTATGRVRWHRPADPPMDRMAVDSGVAVVSDQAPAGGPTTVTAYRVSDGTQLWTRADLVLLANVAAGGRLLLRRYDGTGTVGVDIRTGATRWSSGTSFAVLAADPAGTRFYADSVAGDLVALDAAHGTVAWTARDTSGPLAATPDRLYVATGQRLRALDARTGKSLWDKDLGGLTRRPTVAGGLVYTGSGPDLRVLNATDGSDADPYAATGPVAGHAVVAGGFLYLAGDRILDAFST